MPNPHHPNHIPSTQTGSVNLEGNITIHGDMAGQVSIEIARDFGLGNSGEQRVLRNTSRFW